MTCLYVCFSCETAERMSIECVNYGVGDWLCYEDNLILIHIGTNISTNLHEAEIVNNWCLKASHGIGIKPNKDSIEVDSFI